MDKNDYYKHVHPDAPASHGPSNWAAINELLNTQQIFALEGRYGAVATTLSKHAPVESLLEVGCGLGETSAWMMRYARRVEGCDISLQTRLKSSQGIPLSFSEMDADRPWPLADRSYDVVVAMMVMEHVFDPFHFVRECARVMTDDGILFLNVPLISFYRHRFDVLIGRVPTTSSAGWFERGVWDGTHIHYFNLPLLEKLLGTAGLTIRETHAVGRFHQIKALWPSLLCAEISLVVRRAATRTSP
jgi:SAM-dependent methyltransferase